MPAVRAGRRLGRASRRTVEVVVEVAPGVPLDADPDQLTRVVTNLCINASQAMNATGHIWIDAHREGAVTILRVRDDGPGIPSNLREQIFEALFTTKAKGSGLGLALCRRIAEAHGGTGDARAVGAAAPPSGSSSPTPAPKRSPAESSAQDLRPTGD